MDKQEAATVREECGGVDWLRHDPVDGPRVTNPRWSTKPFGRESSALLLGALILGDGIGEVQPTHKVHTQFLPRIREPNVPSKHQTISNTKHSAR